MDVGIPTSLTNVKVAPPGTLRNRSIEMGKSPNPVKLKSGPIRVEASSNTKPAPDTVPIKPNGVGIEDGSAEGLNVGENVGSGVGF